MARDEDWDSPGNVERKLYHADQLLADDNPSSQVVSSVEASRCVAHSDMGIGTGDIGIHLASNPNLVGAYGADVSVGQSPLSYVMAAELDRDEGIEPD